MNRSRIGKSVLVALAATAVMTTAAAWGDAFEEITVTGTVIGESTKVSWRELDVDKRAGAEILYRRLENAAKQVCGVPLARKERLTSEFSAAYSCAQRTLDAAVHDVDKELVSMIHNGN